MCSARRFCFAILADLNSGRIYTDQQENVPSTIIQQYEIIFVAYVYDINAILAIPLKTRTSQTMVSTFEQVIKYLDKQDCKTIVNMIDMECSNVVEQCINNNNIVIELCHQKSLSE